MSDVVDIGQAAATAHKCSGRTRPILAADRQDFYKEVDTKMKSTKNKRRTVS